MSHEILFFLKADSISSEVQIKSIIIDIIWKRLWKFEKKYGGSGDIPQCIKDISRISLKQGEKLTVSKILIMSWKYCKIYNRKI